MCEEVEEALTAWDLADDARDLKLDREEDEREER
jgi:hypothetical protein